MAKKYVDNTALQYVLGQLLVKYDARYAADGHLHALGDVDGLTAALQSKVEAGDVDKLSYTNESMSAVANVKDALDTLVNNVVANKSDLLTLQGGADVAGSVDKKVADAIAAIDSSALEARIKSNEDALTVLNGDASVVGSVAARVKEIVGTAPEALDTLKELADALGNDKDFAATVTTKLAEKAEKVHTHVVADLTDLQAVLDGKVDKVEGKSLVSDADIAKIALIDGKADASDLDALMKTADADAKFATITAVEGKVDKNGTDRLMTVEEGAKLADIDTITNADIDTILAAVFL